MASPCSLLSRIYGATHLSAANTDSDTDLSDALQWAQRAIAYDGRSDEAHRCARICIPHLEAHNCQLVDLGLAKD
ncbi:MAG: hypothetical protein ACJAY2_001949 [Pseudomonadales bacterium]|jgi:hypothetical protein